MSYNYERDYYRRSQEELYRKQSHFWRVTWKVLLTIIWVLILIMGIIFTVHGFQENASHMQLGRNYDTQKFCGICLIVLSVFFSLAHWFKLWFWLPLRIMITVAGLLLFVWGVGGCVNAYGSHAVAWADIAGWGAIVSIIVSFFFFIIPWLPSWNQKYKEPVIAVQHGQDQYKEWKKNHKNDKREW